MAMDVDAGACTPTELTHAIRFFLSHRQTRDDAYFDLSVNFNSTQATTLTTMAITAREWEAQTWRCHEGTVAQLLLYDANQHRDSQDYLSRTPDPVHTWTFPESVIRNIRTNRISNYLSASPTNLLIREEILRGLKFGTLLLMLRLVPDKVPNVSGHVLLLVKCQSISI